MIGPDRKRSTFRFVLIRIFGGWHCACCAGFDALSCEFFAGISIFLLLSFHGIRQHGVAFRDSESVRMKQPKNVRIHILPPTDGLPTRSGTVVIVDVLRASTTIVSALTNGAVGVIPCLSIDDARAAAQQYDALLGGERGGVKVDGFDCGNSPTEYPPHVVKDRVLAFTTTNGTRALHQSLNAAHILIGSFVNLTAVVNFCENTSADLDIVCAGTDGAISAEDVLFAGLLASKLIQTGQFRPADDATRIAVDFSETNADNPPRLLDAVRASQGGRNLITLGFDADIQFAANIDRFSIVPIYDPNTGQITAGQLA